MKYYRIDVYASYVYQTQSDYVAVEDDNNFDVKAYAKKIASENAIYFNENPDEASWEVVEIDKSEYNNNVDYNADSRRALFEDLKKAGVCATKAMNPLLHMGSEKRQKFKTTFPACLLSTENFYDYGEDRKTTLEYDNEELRKVISKYLYIIEIEICEDCCRCAGW